MSPRGLKVSGSVGSSFTLRDETLLICNNWTLGHIINDGYCLNITVEACRFHFMLKYLSFFNESGIDYILHSERSADVLIHPGV